MTSEQARMIERGELISSLRSLAWRIGPARRPMDIKAEIEEIVSSLEFRQRLANDGIELVTKEQGAKQ